MLGNPFNEAYQILASLPIDGTVRLADGSAIHVAAGFHLGVEIDGTTDFERMGLE